MKKVFLFALLAAAALTLVSCEKETIDGKGDNSSSSPSTSDVFYSVVSQLVNKNELVGDYSKKTFQPTIGIADGGDESVRVVATNSLEAAVNRYNTLTGASIDTNTVSHTFSDKAVGTLTWSKNTDNKAFGTVTASIPSVPTLQKIIYRAGDQGDVNGSFGVNGKATAYYRFGDVIKRTRKEDGVVEYWVCVRPAFTFEEKEKSHWISVSPLPKDKLWEYYDTGKPFTASNNMDYSLPWKIGTDLEWHQDLAEMLFAIMYPEDWATNIQNYSSLSMFGRPSGLPIFNDWHCDNIKYHNKYFWENVQKAWKINSIVEKVFGVSFDEMKALLKQPNANGQGGGPGLYLLYDGSYWSTRFSNKPNLYQVHYFHGTKDTKKNMHEKDTDKPCSQVVVPKNLTEGANNYPLDFYKSMTVQKPYIKEQRFFGDDQPRWVVRYAEGAELASRVYDPMQVISDFQGDNEVYRYYRDVLVRSNLAEEPEIPALAAFVVNDKSKQSNTSFDGNSHYQIGDVLRDQNGYRWIVIKQSGGSEAQNPSTDKSPYTELVSFEGIAYSQDKKTATNIVTPERLIRVSVPLWHFVAETYKRYPQFQVLQSNPRMLYEHLKLYADVDLLSLMQHAHVKGYNATDNTPQGAQMCSFAYYEPGAQKQRTLRFIVDTDHKNEFITVMYDLYPKQNSTINDYPGITSAGFSPESIYLQDVADQTLVNKYADDYLAKAKIGVPSGDTRTARQTADNRALDVTNYFYNMTTWTEGTQPLGMWNEPVVFMRATAVYDRGTEYATRTIDGQELSVLGHIEELYTDPYYWYQSGLAYQQEQDRHLNGICPSSIPSWQAVWLK